MFSFSLFGNKIRILESGQHAKQIQRIFDCEGFENTEGIDLD